MRCHLPYNAELRAEIDAERKGGPKVPGGFPVIPGLTLDQEAEWGLYVGLPCFMFLTSRDRAIWYRLQPIAAGQCKLVTTTLVAPEALEQPDYAETLAAETKMLADFHVEDMVITAAVQRGLQSSRVVRGRLSHLEEPIWQLQRYLAARAQGTYPVCESPQ